MKKCPSCKNTYEDNLRFCPTDGLRLITDSQDCVIYPGELLEKQYEIIREMGKDGPWIVYLGKVLGTGRNILIKVMPLGPMQENGRFERFKQRLLTLQKKVHPGLIRVLDFGIFEDSFFYVATEYAEGENLEKLIGEVGEFSLNLSVSIVKQILMALEFLHKCKLLHLALTPSKIFLVQSLGDTHFIKIDALASPDTGNEKNDYTAPELFYGYAPGPGCDVYSVGVILYRMLAGVIPFPQEFFLALPRGNFPTPLGIKDVKPDLKISHGLEKTILHAVEWMPKRRYPTIQAFSHALRRAKPRPAKKIWAVIVLVFVALCFVPKSCTSRMHDFIRDFTEKRSGKKSDNFKGPKNRYLHRARQVFSDYEKELPAILRNRRYKDVGPRLFSTSDKYPNISNAKVTNKLRKVFADNACPLSEPRIEIKKPGKRWVIKDREKEYLLVKEEKNSLGVYRHRMRKIEGGLTFVPHSSKTAKVKPFYIDCTEVTNEQYSIFVQQSGHSPPNYWRDGALAKQKHYPVVEVNWYDADLYARWSGKRLPTEAQWEIAAHGEKDGKWVWGNNLRNYANVKGSGLLPVGSFKDRWKENWQCPPAVVDLIGNVWEWTDSWYDPLLKQDRTIKGGSYLSDYTQSMISYRDGFFPASCRRDIGFRCVEVISDPR